MSALVGMAKVTRFDIYQESFFVVSKTKETVCATQNNPRRYLTLPKEVEKIT